MVGHAAAACGDRHGHGDAAGIREVGKPVGGQAQDDHARVCRRRAIVLGRARRDACRAKGETAKPVAAAVPAKATPANTSTAPAVAAPRKAATPPARAVATPQARRQPKVRVVFADTAWSDVPTATTTPAAPTTSATPEAAPAPDRWRVQPTPRPRRLRRRRLRLRPGAQQR
jgi:hypothetical protein